MNTLKLAVDADGIAIITIDVPDRPMNVVTPEFSAELAQAVERVATDAAIKGAVLISGKPGAFVAGGDIKGMVGVYDSGAGAAEASKISTETSQLLRRMETCGKPFAAAINGLALGGGLELCLACHYRVLVDDPKAVIGLPERGCRQGILGGAVRPHGTKETSLWQQCAR